jgi:glycosyltransferase involved in cell wall biosynthesis
MNQNISIAFPTRNRLNKVNRFLESIVRTTHQNNRPFILAVSDSPPNAIEPSYLIQMFLFGGLREFNVIANLTKKGLAALWNDCVINSPTDWVLICNDDIVLKPGWMEFLENQISSQKYEQIIIAHYGGMCLHKSLILKMGWFDENFLGGGFEDIDWQLRLSEGGLKELVDISSDFTGSTVIDRPRGWCHDFGPFAEHFKINEIIEGKTTGWNGENNEEYMKLKWGRQEVTDWKSPSVRKIKEIDWHPFYTKHYEKRFSRPASFIKELNSKEVYP